MESSEETSSKEEKQAGLRFPLRAQGRPIMLHKHAWGGGGEGITEAQKEEQIQKTQEF